jgi:hypothetical protein
MHGGFERCAPVIDIPSTHQWGRSRCKAHARVSEVTPSSRHRFYRLLDALGLLLLAGGLIVAITGGKRFEVVGLTISLRGEMRMFFWAALCLLIPYFRDRDRSAVHRFLVAARRPSPSDEAALFRSLPARPLRRRALEIGLLVLGFCALVAALTWPQAARLYWVSDLGDPLFSVWRIAWVSHQLPLDPAHLFDGNIFHPEPRTLTYSDPVLVPAVLTAPFFWAGGHPVVLYNLLFLSGFVFSGVTMFLLTRALTGQRAAAAVAGAIFAVYPYRLEHYSHLELQMTMWMPLALYALHRTLARERLRDGLATGAAFGLQTLSCLYYGVFFSVYLLPLTAILWIGRRSGWRAVRSLTAGAALALALVTPVAIAFAQSKTVVGERDVAIVKYYSAEVADYIDANPRSLLYAKLIEPGDPERELFPGLTPIVLTVIALWTPLSAVRVAYALALAVAFDASLGMNGWTYPWLHEYVGPFRSLRVPARFSILVGMTLAILSAYGAARLMRRWPHRRTAILVGLVAAVAIEALPKIPIEPVWREPPSVYGSLKQGEPQVLAEFPMASNEQEFAIDTRYLYFSTKHWQNMVNGNSGFFPSSYYDLIERMRDFPGEPAIRYLRRRGVTHLGVHGAFYPTPRRFAEVIAQLDERGDLELVSSTRWAGSESRLYRFRR